MDNDFGQYYCRRNIVNHVENSLIANNTAKTKPQPKQEEIQLFDTQTATSDISFSQNTTFESTKSLSQTTLLPFCKNTDEMQAYFTFRESFQKEGKEKLLQSIELLMLTREQYQKQLEKEPNNLTLITALDIINHQADISISFLEYAKYKYETPIKKIDENKLAELEKNLNEVTQPKATLAFDMQNEAGEVFEQTTLGQNKTSSKNPDNPNEHTSVSYTNTLMQDTSAYTEETQEIQLSDTNKRGISDLNKGNDTASTKTDNSDIKTEYTNTESEIILQASHDINSETYYQLLQELQENGYLEDEACKIAQKYYKYTANNFTPGEAKQGVLDYANFYLSITNSKLSNDNKTKLSELYDKYFIEGKSSDEATVLALEELTNTL